MQRASCSQAGSSAVKYGCIESTACEHAAGTAPLWCSGVWPSRYRITPCAPHPPKLCCMLTAGHGRCPFVAPQQAP